MTDVTSLAAVASSRRQKWLERVSPASRTGQIVQFLAIAVQLAILMFLLRLFEIEPGSGLLRLLPLIFAGFVVHAALPMRWRLQFFLVLSVTAIGMVLGPVAGAVLVLIALVMIGACHLPVAFSTRVLLILLIAGALAAIRGGLIGVPAALLSALATPSLPKLVLPVLGSMFMFRMVIYLYDLRQEERLVASGKPLKGTAAPASVWARLSYFFLLPNVCFLLFPIVDYRTYRRTYYDTDAPSIYQKGVWWICLGLVQLLLYRVVYHYLVPAPEEVQGLAGVVRFMVSSYLIYLRVVGQFHLITGLLCLFGFNLPPAHTFYLLASSFTDFWRRARIEWKDFMVKVFYYPALVPLQRKWGPTLALILATIAVFIITWLLHSYQWFWLRGDFRLSGSDGVFWTIVGGCVLVNSLLEARRVRTKAPSKWTVGPAIVHALQVMGMFIFMCVLWSYWSSPSVRIWLSYLTAVEESGPAAYAALIGSLLVVLAGGVFAQYIAARVAPTPAARRAPRQAKTPAAVLWRPAAVLAAAALLLFVRVPQTQSALGAPVVEVVSNLSTNHLNAVDQDREDRGYYEVLLDEPRSTVAWMAAAGAPPGEGAPPGSSEVDAGDVSGPTNGVEPAPPAAPSVPVDSEAAAPASPGEDRQPPVAANTQAAPATGPEPALDKPGKHAASSVVDSPKILVSPVTTSKAAGASGSGIDTAQKVLGWRKRPYERMTTDMTLWENAPNFSGNFKDTPLRTNQWGMRDKEYSLKPPPHTYRMVLLGSSLTVGAGVPVEQTMETVIEDRLNRDGPGAPRRRYEILNFSVGAYGIMQNDAVLDRKVWAFAPNAVLVAVFSVDGGRMVGYLSKLVRSRMPIPYPYVRQKLLETGVNATMQDPELRRRLGPVAEDLVRWSYRHIVEECRRHGVSVLGVVLPEPTQERDHDIDQSVRLAKAAGLPLLDTRGVYDGQPVDSLTLFANGDRHWNARGNKLMADRVYELLRENDARTLKLGFPSKPTAGFDPDPTRGLTMLASFSKSRSATRARASTRRQIPSGQLASWGETSSTASTSSPSFTAASPQREGQLLKGPWLQLTRDFLEFELRPSFRIMYENQFPFQTNRWGMRDKEYSLTPPPRTYRFALLGSSVELGAGVPVERDYESVLEDRLNREASASNRRHFEILNFSVGSYSILQNVVVADRKILQFKPNAVLLAIHSMEPKPTARFLMTLIRSRTPIPYPYVAQKLRQTGAEPGMADPELRRRLQPVLDDLVRWGYQRIAQIGREHQLPVVALVVPRADLPPAEGKVLAKQVQMATESGMLVINLEDAFDGEPPGSLRLPPPNNHPSARGHQLLADRLYERLRASDATGLKLGLANRRTSFQGGPTRNRTRVMALR